MTRIFEEYINEFVIVYIDDIIIFSNTIEEHFQHILKVFEVLAKADLKLGYDKCVFF